MATSRRLITLSLAFGAIACAADPTLLNLAMPDAKVAFGVNVEKIVASPIGQQLRAQIGQAPAELLQIFQSTGFDPSRDLKEILIVSTGQGQNAPTLIMARGTFDIDKLSAFAATSGRPAVLYEGVPILTHPSKSSGAMAMLDSTTVIGGDLDQVQAAIRRRAKSAPADTEFAARAAKLSEQYDVWGFSGVSLAGMVPTAAPNPQLQQAAEMLKAIRQVSGGMRFSPDMEMALDLATRTQKDAENIHADGAQRGPTRRHAWHARCNNQQHPANRAAEGPTRRYRPDHSVLGKGHGNGHAAAEPEQLTGPSRCCHARKSAT